MCRSLISGNFQQPTKSGVGVNFLSERLVVIGMDSCVSNQYVHMKTDECA